MPAVPAQGDAATPGVAGGERHRYRHGRRDPPTLSRAVLHHEGRARHGARTGDGLRDGAAAWLRRSRSTARLASARRCGSFSLSAAPLRPPPREFRRCNPRPATCAYSSWTTIRVLNESLRNTLQADGHQVTTAGGGQAGIDAFRSAQQGSEPFDIVITDLGNAVRRWTPGRRQRTRAQPRIRRSSCSPAGGSNWRRITSGSRGWTAFLANRRACRNCAARSPN